MARVRVRVRARVRVRIRVRAGSQGTVWTTLSFDTLPHRETPYLIGLGSGSAFKLGLGLALGLDQALNASELDSCNKLDVGLGLLVLELRSDFGPVLRVRVRLGLGLGLSVEGNL
eukprot:1395561-Amorphochlora_amoeboformis.AAC.1